VFLSQNHESDRAYVERLAALLTGAGVPVAYRTGQAEDQWGEVLHKIQTCAVFVVVMTPEAEASGRVAGEIDHAVRAHRPIIALLLRGHPFASLVNTPYENVTGGVMPSARFIAYLQSMLSNAPMGVPGPAAVTVAPAAKNNTRLTLVLVAVGLAVLVVCGVIGVAGAFSLGAFRTATTTTTAAPVVPTEPHVSTPPTVPVDSALSTKPVVTKGDGVLSRLVVTTIVEGKGAKVVRGQTITVNFVGVTYATGDEFDSSWKRGEPFSAEIGVGTLIQGWDQGLLGVRVGSRVQLDIPAALAYGDAASNGSPTGALRYVVDILAAS
jgi:peptidylprolyl isomerase